MGIFAATWREKTRVEEALKKVFKLPGFRQGQEAIVRDITSGHDTLAVMPTGAGKSLCYQLPAVVTPGLTLVISPLIALMKDQVDSLKSKGIRAEALHSGITYSEQQAIIEDVAVEAIKILFVAPERLQTAAFQSLLSRIHVGLIAVDEAHCISQWGHDFRPAYRRIGELRTTLNDPPTIALTATASEEVQKDIVAQLHLKDPRTHILGFDRKNLLYSVKVLQTDAQKINFIIDFILHNIQQTCFSEPAFQGCGIVYASTINQANQLYEKLNACGIRTGLYHAGLSAEERNRIQDAFKEDAYHCLVATNAFGMGVDKPNIRYVIHMSVSSSVEAYSQEAGRAGRDRKPAQCILLYAPKDVRIQESFISNNAPDLVVYKSILDTFAAKTKSKLPVPGTRATLPEIRANYSRKVGKTTKTEKSGKSSNDGVFDVALRKLRSLDHLDISVSGELIWLSQCPKNLASHLANESKQQADSAKKRLKSLISYCYEEKCRTKFILKYFGSRDYKLFSGCQHCDLCHAMFPADSPGEEGAFPPEPTSVVVLKILSTIARYNKNQTDITTRAAADLLHGSGKAPEFATTFRALAYMSDTEITVIISLLIESQLLARACGKLYLTETGVHYMMSKEHRLDACAPVLAAYLNRRFPNADNHAQPWSPEK